MRLERFSERGMGTNIEDIKVPNQRLVGTKNAKPHEYRKPKNNSDRVIQDVASQSDGLALNNARFE